MFKKKVFMIFLCLMVMFGFSREVLAITWKAKNGSVQVKYVHTPHSTVLNKKICYTKDGKEHCKTSYCTGLTVGAPKTGVEMVIVENSKIWPGAGDAFSIKARYVIEYIKSKSNLKYNGKSEGARYVYTQLGLSCLIASSDGKGLADHSAIKKVFKSECSDKTVVKALDYARKKFKNEVDLTTTLPTITLPQKQTLSRIGTSNDYISKAFKIGFSPKKGNLPINYTYSVTIEKGKGTAYLCTTNSFKTGSCSTSGTTLNANQNYYIYVKSNSTTTAGNITLNVTGTNSSKYPTIAMWKYIKDKKNPSYQREITTNGEFPVNRKTINSTTFSFSSGYSATLTKVDENGNALKGSGLKLYVASDENGDNEITTLCNITNDVSSCVKDNLDTSYWKSGNYVCYKETVSPSGYKKVAVNCEPINTDKTNTDVYYKFVPSENGDGNWDVIEKSEYNKHYSGRLACITKTVEGNSGEIINADFSNIVSKLGIDQNEHTEGNITIKKGDACLNETNSSVTQNPESSEGSNTGSDTGSSDTGGTEPSNPTVTINKSVCLYSENGTSYQYSVKPDNSTDDSWKEFCNQTTVTQFSSAGGIYNISVVNSLNTVNISKKAITGDDELPGATLEIYPVVDGKCSNTIATAKDFRFNPAVIEEDTTIEDDDTSDDNNETSSSDSNNGDDSEEDNSAVESTVSIFPKKNSAGEFELSWNSYSGYAIISGIKAGRYCLIEKIPPAGYELVKTTTMFDMSDDGAVSLVAGSEGEATSVDSNGNKIVVLKDKLNKMTVSKTDMTSTKEVPGAKITICTAGADNELVLENNGECVPAFLANGDEATWTSTDKPHIIEGLPSGNYYLVEKVAPSGYSTAESIFFTMTDEGQLLDKNGKSLSDNKLVMKDELIKDAKTGGLGMHIVFAVLLFSSICGVGSYFFLKKQNNVV